MRPSILLAAALAGCTKPVPTPTTPAPEPACAEPVAGAIPIDPDGPSTQIHATGAAGHDGVWLAYNRPDNSGLFDVFAVHLACDGTVDVGPIQVDDSDDNEIEPAVAVLGDDVLVAWQADNGADSANLSIRWRVLSPDGGPTTPVQILDHADNAWMPAVAAGPDGFALTGSWADGGVWNVFEIGLDPAGAPVGTPASLPGDPGTGRVWPSIGVADDGSTLVAFEQDETVAWSRDGGTPETFAGGGAAPSVAEDASQIAYSDPTGALFLAEPGADPSAFDAGSGLHFGATVAADASGPALAWYTNVSGLQNEVHAARVDGAPIALGTGDSPPYGMRLVAVFDGWFFLAWQTGENPDYRVEGAFFAL